MADPVLTVDEIRYYGDWMANHERIHWRQLDRIVVALTRDADLGAEPVRA